MSSQETPKENNPPTPQPPLSPSPPPPLSPSPPFSPSQPVKSPESVIIPGSPAIQAGDAQDHTVVAANVVIDDKSDDPKACILSTVLRLDAREVQGDPLGDISKAQLGSVAIRLQTFEEVLGRPTALKAQKLSILEPGDFVPQRGDVVLAISAVPVVGTFGVHIVCPNPTELLPTNIPFLDFMSFWERFKHHGPRGASSSVATQTESETITTDEVVPPPQEFAAPPPQVNNPRAQSLLSDPRVQALPPDLQRMLVTGQGTLARQAAKAQRRVNRAPPGPQQPVPERDQGNARSRSSSGNRPPTCVAQAEAQPSRSRREDDNSSAWVQRARRVPSNERAPRGRRSPHRTPSPYSRQGDQRNEMRDSRRNEFHGQAGFPPTQFPHEQEYRDGPQPLMQVQVQPWQQMPNAPPPIQPGYYNNQPGPFVPMATQPVFFPPAGPSQVFYSNQVPMAPPPPAFGPPRHAQDCPCVQCFYQRQ